MNNIDIKKLPEYDNHEKIVFLENKDTGLKGFIAIHNTNLGPAVGGTRLFKYASEEDALRDALNLSRAMSYKCALSSVNYGGGKGVIMADKNDKTEELLKSYAEEVNKLSGIFFTGEDVGLNKEDTKILSENSEFIIGKSGVGGTPSPWAALSVFYAIKAVSEFTDKKIENMTFAIKGVGNVGMELCRLLYEKGAKVFVSDIDNEKTNKAKELYPNIKIIDTSEIHKEKVDVFAPCAMGNEIRESNLEELNCKIICGAANNQLESLSVAQKLHDLNILYVPDYIANAGGLINVVDELDPAGYNRERVIKNVENVKNTVLDILNRSKKENISTSEISDEIAKDRIFKK